MKLQCTTWKRTGIVNLLIAARITLKGLWSDISIEQCYTTMRMALINIGRPVTIYQSTWVTVGSKLSSYKGQERYIVYIEKGLCIRETFCCKNDSGFSLLDTGLTAGCASRYSRPRTPLTLGKEHAVIVEKATLVRALFLSLRATSRYTIYCGNFVVSPVLYFILYYFIFIIYLLTILVKFDFYG